MTNEQKPFWVEYGVQGELRNVVDHFVINLPAFEPGAVLPDPTSAIDYRLGELTSYFTHFSFRIVPGTVKSADTVNEALQQSDKDYCLIQNYGHLFYGADALSKAIKEEIGRCEFITGHIMEKGGYYYLHNQCFLVNRRAWLKLGCPDFGMPLTGRQHVSRPDRSDGNVHDDYTPLYLGPSTDSHDVDGTFGYGWNAISTGVANGLTTRNWSDETRKHKRFCYAYYGRLQEWLDALSNVPEAPESDDKMLTEILAFLRSVPDKDGAEKKIFLYNTEYDVDVPNLYFSRGIDRAFLLASGFKGNRILDKVGMGPKTEVVIYDYSRASLEFRRRMIAEWDGRNFPAFARKTVAAMSEDLSAKIQVIPHEIFNDDAAMTREFEREVFDHFDGEANWLEHWEAYRQLPHSFELVDLVGKPTDTRRLFAQHAQGNCLIWISDMFDSPNAIGKFAHTYRIMAYSEILRMSKIYAESVCVIGGPDTSWSWI